jgi:hypothetical protein
MGSHYSKLGKDGGLLATIIKLFCHYHTGCLKESKSGFKGICYEDVEKMKADDGSLGKDVGECIGVYMNV